MKTVEPKGRMCFLNYLSDRGGVGYIRAILPFTVLGSMRYKKMSFDPVYLSNFVTDVNFYKTMSLVKFQRSAETSHLEMLKYFTRSIKKQTNTPTIYEIDDLLFDIPKSNFAHQYYKEREPYIKEMMKMVDGMTVSTSYLRNKYRKYNSNISVVKNRLAKFVWGEIKNCAPEKKERPRIVYPGSQNHFSQDDSGGDFGETLLNFIQKTKKQYEWVFIGGIPHELKDDPDITYYNWISVLQYPMVLKNLNADIGIAPLEINDFNKAKSNLKMLEYTVCGIPGIYTNIEPYKNASLTCANEEIMIDKIQKALSDEDMRYNSWIKDKNTIESDLFLEDNIITWVNEHLKIFDSKLG